MENEELHQGATEHGDGHAVERLTEEAHAVEMEATEELRGEVRVADDHGEAIHQPGPLGDPTFWATVAVLIFLGILVWKKIPAVIGKSLDDRSRQIADELEQARLLREKAQATLSEAERRHAEAEAEAEDIIKAARREASDFADEARKDLAERIARREKLAEQRIARAETEAAQQVRTAAAEAASAAAAQIMREKLAAGAAASQFDSSLDQVKKALS